MTVVPGYLVTVTGEIRAPFRTQQEFGTEPKILEGCQHSLY